MPRTAPAADIDGYLAAATEGARGLLAELRAAIRAEVPEAEEAIAYQIPTFRLDGRNLIHFAAFARHVGLYPAPRAHPDFAAELAGYPGGTGTVRFALDQPLPLALVRRIVRFRADELLARPPARRRPRS